MFPKHATRAVEHFVPVSASGSYYNATTAKELYNSSTLQCNLSTNGVGVFSADGAGTLMPNQSLTTGAFNITESPNIYIASARSVVDPLPIVQLPYWRSHTISSGESITATFKAYTAPTHDVWVIKNITASNETDYTIRIGFTGRRHDEMFSCARREMSSVTYTTPNYTTLGTAQPVDHLIDNLVYLINLNAEAVRKAGSKVLGVDPVFALALSTGNATPSADGVLLNTLAAGTVLTVVSTTNGNWTVTLTEDLATSIKSAATAAGFSLTNDAVLTVNLANSGTTTGGTAEAIMLVATDWPLVWEDRIPQTKVSIRPALAAGFSSSTTVTRYEEAFEGVGVGRHLNLLFKATLAQRYHNLDLFDPTDPSVTSPYSDSGKYDMLIIKSVGTSTTGITGSTPFPRVTYVTFENGFNSSTLRSNLDTWLTSAGMPKIDTN